MSQMAEMKGLIYLYQREEEEGELYLQTMVIRRHEMKWMSYIAQLTKK